MSRTSVIIPARFEPWLNKTIDDVFRNAWGEIEVIVVLDGYLPEEMPTERNQLRFIHHETAWGTRKSMNEAVSQATGKYIFKVDAHCRLSEGYDELLKRDHEPDWVVTLPRYTLVPDTWQIKHPPIEYEYIAYPFEKGRPIGGLTPKKWYGPDGISDDWNRKLYYWIEREKKHIAIDEIQTCNASCWFMEKKRYLELGGMDERYWSFHIDGVELGFKAWLSGGRFMINKKGWHGHWFKKDERRTVPLNWDAMRQTQAYSTWYWTHDKWPLGKRKFKWFVEHFWPLPGWPDNWENDVREMKEPVLTEIPA